MIKSYISDRFFFVQVMNQCSALKLSTCGVPQGAVLSPLLFNLFVNDIPRYPNCHLALFADDIAIYTSHELSAPIINNLNNYVNNLVTYFNKWNLMINTDKCESIYFTRCRAVRKLPSSNIVIQGINLIWKNEVRYLGFTLDKSLTSKSHINKVIEKCNKLLKMLYPLINRNSKMNRNNKILIYKALVLTNILYGAPLFSNIATVHRKKLQIIQNKFLKIIMKKPRRFRTNILHQITSMKLVNDYIEEYQNRYYAKLPHIDNTLINNLVL